MREKQKQRALETVVRIPALAFLLLLSLMLSACVTETTGGFNVEASDTKAA